MIKKTGIIIPVYNECYRLVKEEFCIFLSKQNFYDVCFAISRDDDDVSELSYQLNGINQKKNIYR